jgi:hypothetical protein
MNYFRNFFQHFFSNFKFEFGEYLTGPDRNRSGPVRPVTVVYRAVFLTLVGPHARTRGKNKKDQTVFFTTEGNAGNYARLQPVKAARPLLSWLLQKLLFSRCPLVGL